MKISLGSSRVAMKLLLKILLQCCLPVDGSSAGRGGSAQAARADGVGRAGAQRRARGPRSHACHRSHGGRRGCAAAPGKTPTPPPPNTHTHTHTPPQAARLRVGWGCGEGGGGGGNKAILGLVGISPWGTPRPAEEPPAGMRAARKWGSPARAPAQVPSPPVPRFFGFIWSRLRFLIRRKKKKRQNRNY